MTAQFMFEGAKDATGGGSSNTNRSGRGRSTSRFQTSLGTSRVAQAVASGLRRRNNNAFGQNRDTAGRPTARFGG